MKMLHIFAASKHVTVNSQQTTLIQIPITPLLEFSKYKLAFGIVGPFSKKLLN